MEMVERYRRFRRNLDSADGPNTPWYRRKKIIIISVVTALTLVTTVTALLFSGTLGHLLPDHEQSSDTVLEPEQRVILPLEFIGTCPKTSDKCPPSFQDFTPLILISLDGFRPSFMNRGFSPTIKKIAGCGTHAPYMFSVFPTKTFPNHYTQVTGVYPPYHGIIDNNMYDPVMKKLFKVGQPESLNPDWWQREPIWVTAQKQGKRSGCYYWPGSEVKINGSYPTYYKKYSSKVSFESRVDQILEWLDLPPSSRPHFLTLYVNEPDHALHYFGTKSKKLNDALVKVDNMIERLYTGLQNRNLTNCVDVIITSDHGMSDVSCERLLDLQQYIKVDDTFNTIGPFGRIRPKGGRNATAVDEMVSKLKCKSPHMRVYHKEQLPVRMHYADNPRIEPIFLDLDSGWTVISKSLKDESICSGGAHGYDNKFEDMRAIFIAHGPSFKKNYTMQPFINIEIYEMLAELIGITPNPNNGTRGSLHYIMTSPKSLPPQVEPESPKAADVPVEEAIYNERLSASNCNCPENSKQIQIQNPESTKNVHLPFGIPHSIEDSSFEYLLYNEDYISAFHFTYKMTVWTSFTLKGQKQYKLNDDICWNGDVRIPVNNTLKCPDYMKVIQENQNILQRPLYPPGFSDASKSEQAFLISNSVLKSLNHTNSLENLFNEMLNRWASETGEMNVIAGPAFDIFGSGVKPKPEEFMKRFAKNKASLIPTHIFAVVTWCSVKSASLNVCDSSKLQAQGFLLPNFPYPQNCEAAADVIIKNVARVVDIEKLTGLSFYTKLNIYDAIRLRAMMPERRFSL